MTDIDITEAIRKLIANAVREGLGLIIEKQLTPHGYFRWPTISYFKNGLPNLSEYPTYSGPPDYKSLFHGYGHQINTEEISSFQNLLSYIISQPSLRKRYFMNFDSGKDESEDVTKQVSKNIVYSLPIDIIDRYIHIHQTKEFDDEKFELIYEPLAKTIFLDRLDFDICVPILFVKFGFDEISLGGQAYIERMDDKFQLARFPLTYYGSGVHPTVMSAATHCFVLRNWNVPNENFFQIRLMLSEIQSYSNAIVFIDNFFASLRLVKGINTGYSQVLIRPNNWALNYMADLPPIDGTSINAYPSWFENYYWLEDNIPELTEVVAKEIGKFLGKISDIEENSMHLAIKRLNRCFLRETEEDYLLDATIGLEALLSGDDRQEIAHKLAMRMGALAKLENVNTKKQYQVFSDIKKIYRDRSTIVHGKTKSSNDKGIGLKNKPKGPGSSLPTEYLRMAIKILVENPQYRKPENIDKFLLLNYKDE